jgi:transposase-like protein
MVPAGQEQAVCGSDDLTDTRHISRLEIVDTGRRRRWSTAEKLRIVGESFSAPRLASATARRHGISNQLLFAWRKALSRRAAWRHSRIRAGNDRAGGPEQGYTIARGSVSG